ncbi:MAG: AMP-binding protein, partial [Parachlamydiaceae bacterium]|nr:AMP-binding protein [Parachlamydiaceae bacterium]
DKHWSSYSTQQLIDEVRFVALGLYEIGVRSGEMIGLLAAPSSEWVIIDLAIMSSGAVTVPLFANISDENFLFEVMQTEMKTVIVSGKEQWDMYSKHGYHFNKIITFDVETCDKCISYKSLLLRGKQLDAEKPTLYSEITGKVSPDTLATIIYTSGTGGIPKGVELTHFNIVSLFDFEGFNWDPPTDSYLSILPLAHVFGRCFNLLMICWGISVYYLNDIKGMSAQCAEIHPTILVVVPRLLEKMYAKMLAKVEHAGGMKRPLGLWAFELANQEQDSFYKTLMHPIADKIVYSALRSALGSKVRILISGGAALNPHLCHFFIHVGIPVFEGWGLTEASTVCVNTLKHRKVGSVGQPIRRNEVKTSAENELLVRAPIVMRGYYKNPEYSAKVLDSEGWLHTGDKGYIDKDGFVFIQGRLKEMLKTSTGEYIAPVPIEQALCKVPLIDMALVVGDNRKFASCLLFPDQEVLNSLRTLHGAQDMPFEKFVNGEFITGEIKNLLNNLNMNLNHWEQLHNFRIVLAPLTVESGDLTPSMKIRREIITKKYSDLINEMYAEEKND